MQASIGSHLLLTILVASYKNFSHKQPVLVSSGGGGGGGKLEIPLVASSNRIWDKLCPGEPQFNR